MDIGERAVAFLVTFIVGALVGYLFYGGIGKDIDGNPTTITYILNVLIPFLSGTVLGFMYIPVRINKKIYMQKQQLNLQFRDMLDSFSTSISAGKNIDGAFNSALGDMKAQYGLDSYIVKELEVIVSGISNNVAIEELLDDFGKRSGSDDIRSFANVFKICYRKGGSIRETIKNTNRILSDKMEIKEDIETIVTANKTEQSVMIIMPVMLVGIIKMMSPDFADNFTSVTGVISTTIAVILFAIAYIVAKKVLDIRI